ncbi:hypothetical protein AB0F17_34845 [Nonomuraea sp. NPDC026600]|uniref:hypothetical protein n=1 Tax=Nonomuraea sp. NPDC026600 TaxID=3155363 RepID=UPI0034036504
MAAIAEFIAPPVHKMNPIARKQPTRAPGADVAIADAVRAKVRAAFLLWENTARRAATAADSGEPDCEALADEARRHRYHLDKALGLPITARLRQEATERGWDTDQLGGGPR